MVNQGAGVRRYSTTVGADVDFDPAIWLGVPTGFAQWGGSHSAWAANIAEVCWSESKVSPGPYMVENLAMRLTLLAEMAMEEPLNHLYLHLPDPGAKIASARLQVLEPERRLFADERLRDLVEADGALLVEAFDAPRLGRGLRSWRRDPMEDEAGNPVTDEAFGMWKYGWHVAEFDVDVVLYSANTDLDRLRAMSRDLDDLARAVRLDTYERLEGGG